MRHAAQAGISEAIYRLGFKQEGDSTELAQVVTTPDSDGSVMPGIATVSPSGLFTEVRFDDQAHNIRRTHARYGSGPDFDVMGGTTDYYISGEDTVSTSIDPGSGVMTVSNLQGFVVNARMSPFDLSFVDGGNTIAASVDPQNRNFYLSGIDEYKLQSPGGMFQNTEFNDIGNIIVQNFHSGATNISYTHNLTTKVREENNINLRRCKSGLMQSEQTFDFIGRVGLERYRDTDPMAPMNNGVQLEFHTATNEIVVKGTESGVDGNLLVTGNLNVNGSKNFRIDHPLDPDHKYLYHSCVESPDMMNIYNGNVTTDVSGFATVLLPEYFEALNIDYRYQLTVLGQFAQAIIKEKIADNRFVIQTDKPNVEVSWQVTGIRNDPAAQRNRTQVEVSK